MAQINTINKEKIKLSASKIKTVEGCSWLYYSKYILKFPDTSNSGASRGTICHLIFELLLTDRHKKYFEDLCSGKAGIIKNPAIHRLILKNAKKLKVDDEENLDLIYMMIQTGLQSDFFCNGSLLVEAESEFKLEEENYIINGFIDKLAKFNDTDYKIYDYKSSKAKFSKEEIDFNLQNLMYSLAVFKTKGHIPDVSFIFLKFKKQPIQEAPKPTEEQLEGFKAYLAYIAGYLSKFDEKNSTENLAANSPKKKWMCGSDVQGKWICPSRLAATYYVGTDANDKYVRASLKREDLLNDAKVALIKKTEYKGCPYWIKNDSTF
jgi:ATP-dependent helicase/DNAse subunit B